MLTLNHPLSKFINSKYDQLNSKKIEKGHVFAFEIESTLGGEKTEIHRANTLHSLFQNILEHINYTKHGFFSRESASDSLEDQNIYILDIVNLVTVETAKTVCDFLDTFTSGDEITLKIDDLTVRVGDFDPVAQPRRDENGLN